MLKYFSIILLVLLSTYSNDILLGHWEGAITRNGSVQLVQIDFNKNENKIEGRYSVPERGIYDVLLDTLSISDSTMFLKFGYGNFTAIIHEKVEEITGINRRWNPEVKLHLKKYGNNLEKNYKSEEAAFSNKDVILKGTIYIPAVSKVNNWVVLVHGSGYQDRETYYYRSFAHVLANAGIGVLFYDKRGCGKSEGEYESSSLGELAEDAIAAADYLSKSNYKPGNIGILGTSQGGWISVIAAGKSDILDFLILNVGPAVSTFEQDINRVEYSMRADGLHEETIDSALVHSRLYFDYLNGNADWRELAQSTSNLKNKPWAYYIQLPEDSTTGKWWKNNNYNPKEGLTHLNIPVLSLFGEIDALVPPNENKELMEKYLSAANVKYNIVVFPNVGHDMQTYSTLIGMNWDFPNNYWVWRKRADNYYSTIIEWIKNLQTQTKSANEL